MTDYYLSPPAAPAPGQDVLAASYNLLNTNTFGLVLLFKYDDLTQTGYLFSTYQCYVALTTTGLIQVGIRTGQFAVPERNNWSYVTSGAAASTGVWHTLVVARNTSKLDSRIYLDGVFIGNLTTVATAINNTFMSDPTVQLGISSRGSTAFDMGPTPLGTTINQYYRGQLNDVAVYRNVTLTSTDAANFTAAAPSTYASVVAAPTCYWTWDTQTAVDSGTNATVVTTPNGLTYASDGLSIDPTTLPDGTFNTAYSQTLTAVNGSGGPYTWSLAAGALPNGLTLNTASTTDTTSITGTPTEVGVFNFTVEVDDGVTTASQPFALTIDPASVTILPATSRQCITNQPFSQTFMVSGGSGATTWSLVGLLPTGLAWDAATATISGTPTVYGEVTGFTVSVSRDGGNYEGSRGYSLSVNNEDAITPNVAPDGTLGVAYALALQANANPGLPHSWYIPEGSLPTGLALGASVTRDNTISGTPTVAGTYTALVAVHVADAFLYGEVEYMIEIAATVSAVDTAFYLTVERCA